jgi:hypothetical protein
VGMPQDPRRARQARHQDLGDEDPNPAAGSGLGPAHRRDGPTWSELLRSQARGVLVETLRLRTLYVLVAIKVGSRQVHVLGVTRNPDSAWVTQQARNLAVGERLEGIRFVIRDRDAKYSGPFDVVLRSEGVSIVKTPIRAPRANAFAERWCARSGPSAWTGCWCSAAATWSRCFGPTSPTTTGEGPTGVLSSRRRTHGLIRLHGRLRVNTFERATCGADLSMSTISLLEVGSRVCVPFRVFDSIWRIRSRLTLNSRPTSAKVRGWPSSNPNRN